MTSQCSKVQDENENIKSEWEIPVEKNLIVLIY